ncbi:FAD-binding molybdopterin dehydrogenase [Rathayibacter rathayi]|uniref:FAD-binding molybdopterin dehydrogenase n=1 Tax=Rathayibacter rathayi TaxID=33887 RepID=A0ABD6W5U4_RATRA|nr:FAD binding domain-containing protein [Rathayibacter rathayi]AZZ48957.1 FAD-binding molybdopterin dehydrogenase [Rathayibacter rathayi]MWV74056.1 FAD-binding molybdopterin dehydrogenase [Rathayibacter rathayi NCPPB 2980 = VKM Ac-1601]PPF11147.1 FAD-binding molybdopterin dehydrogenase [Rathayibacter rathayi]PPF44677.1 FAD-binding molybdopterin dehydrogenase [Rathayibacter rathayi]PPF82771.1 FAD-binding molybdopterin dehydrogenase [Rathayibacter rathayi]
MDLNTIQSVRVVRERSELAGRGPRSAVIGGGSWVFSLPHDHLDELLDLQGFGWEPIVRTADGLSIAATCTLSELAAMPDAGDTAHPIFLQCCTALLGSFKIWNVATVGGNIANALPAGPMISLAAALDASALLWRGDGANVLVPVAELVTGNMTTTLARDDVIRSIEVPRSSLQARTAFRKTALSPLGRSGAVVIGRLDIDGAFVLTITAATVRPELLRFSAAPTAAELAAAIDGVLSWFTDPHGAADWRHAVVRVLAEEIRAELSGGTP